jgi:seryl-tRNA synthetase
MAANSRSTRLVHSPSGSGVAIGRALVAVMENYERPGEAIEIPEPRIPIWAA